MIYRLCMRLVYIELHNCGVDILAGDMQFEMPSALLCLTSKCVTTDRMQCWKQRQAVAFMAFLGLQCKYTPRDGNFQVFPNRTQGHVRTGKVHAMGRLLPQSCSISNYVLLAIMRCKDQCHSSTDCSLQTTNSVSCLTQPLLYNLQQN